MTITTELSSWAYITQTSPSMRDSIISSLGDYADDFDVDGLEEAVREQIDTMLPGGAVLIGDEFYIEVGSGVEIDEVRDALARIGLCGGTSDACDSYDPDAWNALLTRFDLGSDHEQSA